MQTRQRLIPLAVTAALLFFASATTATSQPTTQAENVRVTAFSDTFDECWNAYEEDIKRSEENAPGLADCEQHVGASTIAYDYLTQDGVLMWDDTYLTPTLASNRTDATDSYTRLGAIRNITLPRTGLYVLEVRYRINDTQPGQEDGEFRVSVEHPDGSAEEGGCSEDPDAGFAYDVTQYKRYTVYSQVDPACYLFIGAEDEAIAGDYDIGFQHHGGGILYIDYVRLHRFSGLF